MKKSLPALGPMESVEVKANGAVELNCPTTARLPSVPKVMTPWPLPDAAVAPACACQSGAPAASYLATNTSCAPSAVSFIVGAKVMIPLKFPVTTAPLPSANAATAAPDTVSPGPPACAAHEADSPSLAYFTKNT